MDDIVVRLRKRAAIRLQIRSPQDRISRDLIEAADEIERLRIEVEHLGYEIMNVQNERDAAYYWDDH